VNTYIYSGPTTGLTLRGEKGAKTEVMLFPGKQVQLPDIKEVKTLIALKRLTLVVPSAAPAPAPKAPAAEAAAAVDGPVETGAPSGAAATAKKGA